MIAKEENVQAEALRNYGQGDTPVERLRKLDWPALEEELNAQGSTVLKEFFLRRNARRSRSGIRRTTVSGAKSS